MGIVRTDVVTQIADAVRQWIVDGVLAAGERVNETRVAHQLEVSRTPVREALARLVGEGALVAMPNHGFYVGEISETELDEIYCLRPTLDVLALELGGLPPPTVAEELRQINAVLERSASAGEAVSLDERWHGLLISSCTNGVLLGFIERLIERTRRYELILFEDPTQRRAAARQHDQVMDAIDRADLAAACAALRGNLQRGDAPLRSQLAKTAKAEAR